MGCIGVKGGRGHSGRAAGGHCLGQHCTDGAGIATSPMSVHIPQLYLTFHMLHIWLPLAFFQERTVCFCSAKQWPRSKQQRLHFYALVLEQDSHSLNHHLQSPTAETLVIRNLWDHPRSLQKRFGTFLGGKATGRLKKSYAPSCESWHKGGKCKSATLPWNGFEVVDE